MNPQSQPLTPQPVVRLHIDRLVLDGLALSQPDTVRLQTGLEAELGRLLSGVPSEKWSAGAFARLAGSPVHLTPGVSPKTWGRQIAQTLLATVAPQILPDLPPPTQTPRNNA